jgi:protein TonB
MHGLAVGVVIYLLLAFPQIWYFEIRRGDAVFIEVQMSAVAATQPLEVREVEVSIEPVPIEPPPPVAIDHAPVTDTLEPVPAAIPVVRTGEYEPNDVPPQQKPPESPAKVEQEAKTPQREVAQEPKPQVEVTQQVPDRQVADLVRDSPHKVTVAAAAPTVSGAQVDELPRKLSNNREPYYPVEALRAGLEGRVVLRVQISATGRATKIAVQTSSGFRGFDESAVEAVGNWEFAPARRKGLAVMHEVLVPVRFRIRRG